MRIKVILPAAMAVALLGLGALVGGVIGTGGAFAQTPTATATAAPRKPEVAKNPIAAKLTKEQAEQAAHAASPGNTIDHTTLQIQSGTPVYDVDFTNGGGVLVNGDTGAIIKVEAAGTDQGGLRGGRAGRGGHGGPGGQDQAALAAQAKITKQQAEQAALAASPGNTIDHSRLGKDANGTIFWDVDFTNNGGVIINADTGAVIKIEPAGTDVHGPRGGGKPGATGTPTP